MKKLTGFFMALLLCLLSAGGIRCLLTAPSLMPASSFGTWGSEAKTKSFQGVREKLNSQSLLVFGSSEFQHGTDTPYHPSSMFARTDCQPMLLGAGYYQSLSHAISLSALAQGENKPKQAVLILSPQWFRKSGVLPEAFASRFSESLYLGMLENPDLSRETKSYMEQRSRELLKNSPKTLEWISSYNKVWDSKTACSPEDFAVRAKEDFLKEKERISLPVFYTLDKLASRIPGVSKAFPAASSVSGPHLLEGALPRKGSAPDFQAYKEQAQKDGKRYQNNEFFMDQESYDRLKPSLEKKKGISRHAVNGYGASPEYKDLECFLQVCQELSIRPLLVILPVNGYYYDYTGFPKEARENYYGKILSLARRYQVEIADFSKDEYTKYFFEDRVHLGRKGWVMVNESIYKYFKEG